MFESISSVNLYQYALCNWRILKLKLHRENKQLNFQIIDEDWTSGTVEDENKTLRKSLKSSEFCLCFPSWYGHTGKNLELVKMLWKELNLVNIPVYIYESKPESYLVSTPSQEEINQQELTSEMLETMQQQKKLRDKLIEKNRVITKFSSVFLDSSNINSSNEYSKWLPVDGRAIALDALKGTIVSKLIDYAIICELQTFLTRKKCYGGLIDGDFGQRTQLALRRFRKLQD